MSAKQCLVARQVFWMVMTSFPVMACSGGNLQVNSRSADRPVGRQAETRAMEPSLAAVPLVCGAGLMATADGKCLAQSSPVASGGTTQPTLSGSSSPASLLPPKSESGPARKPGLVAGGLARGVDSPGDQSLLAGDVALGRDDWSRAKKEYSRAQTLDPKDPAPRVGLLRVRLAEAKVSLDYASSPHDAKLNAALKELAGIQKLDANYAPTHLERGRIYLILGQAELALDALRRAVELDPLQAEAHSALGVALLAVGQSLEALDGFRKAAELEPDDADRQTNLGTAYMMRGLVKEAIVAYERAVSLAPDDARAQGDLGTAYLASNQPKSAAVHLARAVELAPERATFLSNLGYAHQMAGDFAGAVREYRAALSKDPRLGSAWINLGTALAKLGSYKEARDAFMRALSLDPSDPRAKANLEELTELEKQAVPGNGASRSPKGP